MYSLTLRHALRLTRQLLMRSILLVAAVLLASSALAGPKKKGRPAAAPAPAPAAAPAPEAAPPAAEANAAGPGVRGPTRIDFDDRLIQGQSNKSGAVYLYDRKELKVRSMIKKRDNFRDEIVGSLYDT